MEANSVDMNNGQVRLYHGDSRDVLKTLADESIDSIVTDPPYALVSIGKRFGKPGAAPAQHGTDGAFARAARGFMGQSWDVGDTAFAMEFWGEVWRVLKPGGHVLAFGGTRTYHRLVCAIEDAGFEIRDRIRFEQSFDTKYGPLIDSLDDAQREALQDLLNDYGDGGSELAWEFGSGFPKSHNQSGDWQGWGSALKPAYEPICLARKPLAGTIAANLAEHGTGALNIDGCRVETDGDNLNGGRVSTKTEGWDRPWKHNADAVAACIERGVAAAAKAESLGRWPANIIHDGSDEVLAAFPVTGLSSDRPRHNAEFKSVAKGRDMPHTTFGHSDNGGSAARFFYCAKASRADRDEGLDGMEKVAPMHGKGNSEGGLSVSNSKLPRANIHPTVKPTSLMQYLCRLITPPGGTVLDPFLGSGSTGKAAVLEGFKFVGIEREDEYFPIAEARIQWALDEVAKPKAKTKARPKRKQPAVANDNTVADLFGSAA